MARPSLVTEITGFYRWFLVMLLCIDCQGCLEVERAALLQIKDSMSSPAGSAFSNWYGEECCEWEGVECDPTRTRIHKIFFHYLREESDGVVEPWYPNATLFAQFEELWELELPGNHIGGFVSTDAFRELKQLQKLDLHDNSINNGSNLCWGKSPSLYFLDLSSNNLLQGNIPDCLCDNLFLKELILFDNSLFGNINLRLGKMVSLQHLDLSDNKFNGSFPSLPISNLTNIESLVLSRNEFHGMISLCIFANLSRLSEFDISFNHLIVESEVDSPSFSLNTLRLSGCNLKNIPGFLSRQERLDVLDLTYNSLLGNIPSWMFYNISSELWLRGNNFTGPFPKNISSRLTLLDISDNFLHGTLPIALGLNFPQLNHLNLSKNSFNGNLPSSFGNQLQKLDLSDNQFQGEIPHSMASNMSCLIYLRLSGNNLTGALFPKNSSLPKIRWLYLSKNLLSGTFPYVLSKSMELEIVDIHNNNLSGEISSYLPVLPKLKVLLLGGNLFEGQIPRQVCQMTELHVLDLSRNGLSGDIPDCVDNITSWKDPGYDGYHRPSYYGNNIEFFLKGRLVSFIRLVSVLTGIDVSSNKLTGRIPIQMTRLSGIVFLNMSNNLLTGQIPSSLANLTNLESLDFSHNNLFGVLPPDLNDLGLLAAFEVSFNNLSGMIPTGRQFDTFLNDSYIGNPGLCGPPLSNKCNDSAETPPVYAGADKSILSYVLLLFWSFLFIILSLE